MIILVLRWISTPRKMRILRVRLRPLFRESGPNRRRFCFWRALISTETTGTKCANMSAVELKTNVFCISCDYRLKTHTLKTRAEYWDHWLINRFRSQNQEILL